MSNNVQEPLCCNSGNGTSNTNSNERTNGCHYEETQEASCDQSLVSHSPVTNLGQQQQQQLLQSQCDMYAKTNNNEVKLVTIGCLADNSKQQPIDSQYISKQGGTQAPPNELSIISQPIVIASSFSSSSTSSSSTFSSSSISAVTDKFNLTNSPKVGHEKEANFTTDTTNAPSTNEAIVPPLPQLPTSSFTPSPPPPPPPPAQLADYSPSHHQHQHRVTNGQWMMMAAQQTRQGVRQRMSLASDHLGYSLRRLYASASSIAADLPPSYQNIPGIVPYYHGRSSGPPPSYDEVVNPYAPPPTYQSLFGQMLEARKKSHGFVDLFRRLLIVSTLGCTMLIAFMILILFTMIIVGAIYMDQCKVEHIPAFLLVGGCVWASKNILHCYVQCQNTDQIDSFNDLEAAQSSSSPSSTNNIVQSGPMGDEHMSTQNGHNHQFTNTTTTTTSSMSRNGVIENEQRHLESRPESNSRRRRRLKSSIYESLLNCVLFGWFIAGCIIVCRNYEPDFENTASERYCNRTVYMYTFWLITSAMLMFGLFVGCICCLMVSSAVASRQDEADLG